VLFDFNGVLIDDESYHWRAFRDVLAPLGARVTRRLYDERYVALDDFAACRRALRDARVAPSRRGAAEVRRLVARKRRLFRARLRRDGIGVGAGGARLVRALARDAALAVVSSAARVEIEAPLRRALLRRCFRVIVAAEDVRRSKPDPDPYRTALRRLGLRGPAGCVAIEDSTGGIAAARAAGLPVLGVATSMPPRVLRRAGAFAVVRSLRAAREVERLLRRHAAGRGRPSPGGSRQSAS
jgi:beta-phosphoglucomutase-like phosphatase (HAD superfamily)